MLLLPTLLLLLVPVAFDLESVKAEPNLDRRADLALENANTALEKAKTSYKESEYKKGQTSVLEIRDSVEVCLEALKATGKDPRKNVRQFKKVEQRIQLLIRRLKGLELEVSVEDRPTIKKVEERLEDINDEIVSGIFTKSK
jgi:hypothetical protein